MFNINFFWFNNYGVHLGKKDQRPHGKKLLSRARGRREANTVLKSMLKQAKPSQTKPKF